MIIDDYQVVFVPYLSDLFLDHNCQFIGCVGLVQCLISENDHPDPGDLIRGGMGGIRPQNTHRIQGVPGRLGPRFTEIADVVVFDGRDLYTVIRKNGGIGYRSQKQKVIIQIIKIILTKLIL